MDLEKFIHKFGGLTEEYKFYDGEVTLRYDEKNHIYFLVTPDGLEKQDGVTTICHIIDKSQVLMHWACKVMAQKLIKSLPVEVVDAVEVIAKRESYGTDYVTLAAIVKLINESKSAHEDELEEAGAIGKSAHSWIETYIKIITGTLQHEITLDGHLNYLKTLDPRVQNTCNAALEWIGAHNVRWIHTERKIYSRSFSYAGTMDGLCLADSCNNSHCCSSVFKDRLTEVDWKTSNYLYPEFILQTSAYKKAYEEEMNVNITDIWIVRLGKDDGEFDPWHLPPEIQFAGWMAFKDALALSRSFAKMQELLDFVKNEQKLKKKAEEQEAKKAALKIKCKTADRYKGVRYPQCNQRHPCETCLKKYNEKHKIIS